MSISRGCLGAALVMVVLSLAPAVRAGEPPAAGEMLRRAEEVRSPDLDYAVDFTLLVADPNTFWKERTTRYTMVAHGKDYSFILIREPRQFYPGTLLIMNNLYWMLFPKAGKPIQLSAAQILSGDISNGDLARGNLLKHYNARLEGEDTVGEDPCWVLDLSRANNVASYTRIRYWITRKKLQPRKLEYYGETERLLKTVQYEDYRKGPMGVRPMRMVVRPQAQPTETTTMTFSNLRRIDMSGVAFDVAGLAALRDAAMSKLGPDGVQAQPEDLLAILRSRGR